eukprot:1512512-Prymnesium_polylepis.1
MVLYESPRPVCNTHTHTPGTRHCPVASVRVTAPYGSPRRHTQHRPRAGVLQRPAASCRKLIPLHEAVVLPVAI